MASKHYQGETEIDWPHYIRLLADHRWIILIPAVLGALMGFGASFLSPERFEARATVLIEPQSLPKSFMKSSLPYGPEAYVRALVEQVKSPTRLAPLIQEFDLYPEAATEVELEAAMNDLRNRITVVRRGPDTFSISYTGDSPEQARDVTRRLTDVFIEENQRFRLDRAKRNVEFLREQADRLIDEVHKQEKAIQDYQATHLDALPAQRESLELELQTTQQQLETTAASLSKARARQAALQERLALLSQSAPSSSGDNAGTESWIDKRITEVRAELTQLQSTLSDDHPDVRRKRHELDSLLKEASSASAHEEIPSRGRGDALDGLEMRRSRREAALATAEVKRLEAERTRLQDRLTEINTRLEKVPELELTLQELEQGLEVRRDQADTFRKKATDAEAAYELEKGNQGSQFRLLDPPRLPDRPVSPDRGAWALIGLLAGFLVPTTLILTLDIIYRPFEDDADLASYTGLDVLISVPQVGPFPSRLHRLLFRLADLFRDLIHQRTILSPDHAGGYALHPRSPSGSGGAPVLEEAEGDPALHAGRFTYLLGEPITGRTRPAPSPHRGGSPIQEDDDAWRPPSESASARRKPGEHEERREFDPHAEGQSSNEARPLPGSTHGLKKDGFPALGWNVSAELPALFTAQSTESLLQRAEPARLHAESHAASNPFTTELHRPPPWEARADATPTEAGGRETGGGEEDGQASLAVGEGDSSQAQRNQ